MPNLYNVPLQNGIQRTLANTLNAGEVTTITFSTSVSSVLQASASIPGTLVIDRVDSNGNLTPSLTEYISFTGVSGSTVTGLVRGLAGTSDIAHSIGAIVEFVPDVTWADAINDTFTVEHNADGTHKASAFASLVSVNLVNSSLDTFTFNTNKAILVSNVSGSINQVTVISSLISTNPTIQATGTDTNISLAISGKGTGYVYPQLLAGRISATSNSQATGTAVDVTGATVTFTPLFNATAIVNTVFDCTSSVANDTNVGVLNYNGTDLANQVIYTQQSANDRLTIGQNYAVSLASGIAVTLKLRIQRNSGTGIFSALFPHTGFNYFVIGR